MSVPPLFLGLLGGLGGPRLTELLRDAPRGSMNSSTTPPKDSALAIPNRGLGGGFECGMGLRADSRDGGVSKAEPQDTGAAWAGAGPPPPQLVA